MSDWWIDWKIDGMLILGKYGMYLIHSWLVLML